MHRPVIAALAAASALVVVALPVLAQSAAQPREIQIRRPICKAAPYTTSSTISAQDAVHRWSGHVRTLHGQSWSHWASAIDRSQATSQQPGGTVHIASGRPCLSIAHLLTP